MRCCFTFDAPAGKLEAVTGEVLEGACCIDSAFTSLLLLTALAGCPTLLLALLLLAVLELLIACSGVSATPDTPLAAAPEGAPDLAAAAKAGAAALLSRGVMTGVAAPDLAAAARAGAALICRGVPAGATAPDLAAAKAGAAALACRGVSVDAPAAATAFCSAATLGLDAVKGDGGLGLEPCT